jgi:beta-lactamase regulating signal transducer with metallopeptidase domain/sugar lactone lactonase YvrE
MNSTLAAFFGWLLRASWQASILVLVVLTAQWIFRRHLSAQWRHALWLLVLLRLVLPSMPSSPMSLYNYARLDALGMRSRPAVAGPKVLPSPASPFALHKTPATTYEETELTIGKTAPAMAIQAQAASTPEWRDELPNFCAFVWLAGAMLTACRVLVQNVLFLRRLRMARVVAAPEILSIFERCRQQLAVRTKIVLVETAQVRSPALYGLFRPKLLLPSGMIGHFGTDELRHVFLHELAHVKRLDVAVSWLVAFGGIFHWFNPALWFGFRRMAGDREMACDELVLAQVGRRESARYGEMILKLLEFCSHSPAVPGLVGILENQPQLKQRIAMIASFGQRRHRPVLAAVLLVSITLVTLTDAQTQTAAGSDGHGSWRNPESNNVSQLSASALTQKGLAEEKTQHNLTNALEAYRAAVAAYDHDRQEAAIAVFHQGEMLRQMGKIEEANDQYRRILRDFPEQTEFAASSRKHLLSLSITPPAFALSIEDVKYPGGVAVDSSGDIYVSDTRRDCIKKFDGNGTFLSQLGGHGSTPGMLIYPQGLAVGPGDCLYVADVQNQRVQKFSSDGKFLVSWGEEGTGQGKFNRPYNVAVDKTGDVYVVDSENNRIQKFTGEGAFLKEFGPVGGDGRQLKGPQGVAVDGDGNVYVGDGSNGRIVKYSADGTYLMDWESPLDPDNTGANGSLMNGHPFVRGGYIHDVAADAQGHVYAVSAGTECVQMFSGHGTLLSQWGSKGAGPGQFDFVARVAVDAAGKRVYVTDAHNNRAQVFAFPPGSDAR